MLKKTIKYTDYNGEEREEDFYFNLSRTELTEWELSVDGGLSNLISSITKEKNVPEIAKKFKEIILKAYGEKSPDGKRFIKSPEISKAFSETNAYDELFMSFFGDNGVNIALDFVKGILPNDIGGSDAIKSAIEAVKH